ncbi:MAG: putative toxin-antitoxin system toxin component, PIN family [Alphaproteobacteria bacterium]|nr:putative toxin-antitoxin system toxin component, PIN family [Alphaproteobacteria bacterium]
MISRLKVVIDTNVLINALAGEAEDRRVVADVLRHCDVYFSPDTFDELDRVLTSPRFAHLDQAKIRSFKDILKEHALWHTPEVVLDVSPDPDDDMFFELAEEIAADVIVSRDKKGVLNVALWNGDFRTAHPQRFLKDVDLVFNTIGKPAKEQAAEREVQEPELA